MYFIKKQKGSVSVFLTLVLVPVMIFALLTVDAARIYSAKVVISDAGEMSMNAALAQYDEGLFDQYGLLAMSSTPESMQGDLEEYFVKSLNSSGITGGTSYEEILKLTEESFDAINVDNTQIYQTEVEKQQILEYMKYRAPVCLTELVLEKFGFIKDSKKLLDAMNKEMDFAEAMEDCQDAFEDALDALDTLNATIESFPTSQNMDDELGQTQADFTTTVARCLLMRAAIQSYDDKPTDKTVEEMMGSYIEAANQVNLESPYSSLSYNKYLDTVYYQNGITAVLAATPEASDSVPAEVISNYNTAKARISGYMSILLNCANSYVSTHYSKLNGYYSKAGTAASQAQNAWEKLDYVREKLLQASNAYNDWDQATSELSDELAGNMPAQVDEYRDFFGGEDLETLSLLQTNISIDKDYFNEIKDVLERETLFDVKIAITETASQVNQYSAKAQAVVAEQDVSYDELETIRQESFVSHYGHTIVETADFMHRIYDDPFYLKLQEYCEKEESDEADEKTDDANQNLNQGAEGAEAAKDDTGYPDYDWSSSAQALPSVVLGLASYTQASETLTGLDSGNDVKSSSARRDVISKMKDSINEAGNFLDGVSGIIEDNVENLYIAEYAMQMFSYYTCNKKMQTDKSLKDLTENENVSMSGYKLSENKAYKAEIEYVLWGNTTSQKNIQSTVMLLFGIRLLFNSIFAFTDIYVNEITTSAATAIAGGVPYLIPIVKVVIKLGLAVAETSTDVDKLKGGYGVAILKNESSFQTLSRTGRGDVRNGVTFDYGEYLRVFLNMQMILGKEKNVLARIGDCIQANTETDITKDYTMLEVQSGVGVKTSFMGRIAEWASSDWSYGDLYTINYKSILGY